MPDLKWKDALRRVTARVALSAGLIGLASHSAPAAIAQPRVPVSPVLTPEATVRKFKERYVLRRVANALTVRFMSHRSHASHASHASHSSHVSSSHYSSSSPVPPPVPTPAPPSEPSLPRSPSRSMIPELQWRVGVLATAPSGARFSGYVSTETFDLNRVTIAVDLRRPARGGTTIFAVANDDANWRGFRIQGAHLIIESHTNGHVSTRKVAYDVTAHRYLRLRTSNAARGVVWETSADGANWNPEYVETSNMNLSAVRIALSAGTTTSTSPGTAAFGRVIVEQKP